MPSTVIVRPCRIRRPELGQRIFEPLIRVRRLPHERDRGLGQFVPGTIAVAVIGLGEVSAALPDFAAVPGITTPAQDHLPHSTPLLVR